MDLNRIDFQNKCFTSCGKKYYINADALGYERLLKFIEWLPVVAVGKSHLDLMTLISGIFKELTTGGDDFKKSYFNASLKCMNYAKSFEGANSESFLNTNLETILRFCALVCNTENEDVTKFSEGVISRKVEDFKKDMNMLDFFFLAKKLVPMYQEKLIELLPKK